MSDTMDKLADVLGHNYDCGLLTEEDDKIAHCTCGSDAVLVQVQAEFDELKRANVVLRRCWERAEQDYSAVFRLLVFVTVLVACVIAVALTGRARP